MEIENDTTSIGERVQIMRRRWIYPTLITPACILIAVFIAFATTPLYRSSGAIMLQPSAVPKELVQTVTSYADQQFELIQREVMTQAGLEELVAKVNPFPNEPGLSAGEKAQRVAESTRIERVDPVTLETLAESNAFSIHYDNPDPRIAQAVAHELLGLFMDYNSRTRHERAAGTYRFLLSESSKLSNSIRDMESQLADFKTRYGDALPQAESRNLQALDAAERSYESTQAQIRLAQERVSMLSLQLDDLSPSLEGAVTDRRTQIATMRAELAEAQKRYTPEHPDVRRLRRAIQDLLAEDRAARSPGARVDNPQYLQVSSQLSAARRELAALRASAGRAADQVTQHSRSLRLTPSVEREYVQLARNYQLAQEHFRELQAKLTEAGLAQALVDEQQGERFMVVRDPALPRGPHSPNRLGVILIGIVLGLALGVGSAMFVEFSDPTVRGAHDLRELTGHIMLAAVPELLNSSDRRTRRRRIATAAIAYGAGVLACALAIMSATF